MQHNKLPAVRQIMVWFLTITSTLCLPLAQAQTTVAGSMPGQFSVSESGAASYRIPIQVPPGVAGMQPRLELVYNSQGGNGLLGMGWSLSGLSAITRCPRTMASDGVRGAVNFDLNDRYCLDGQRLMLVSGTEGTAGAEYRTERESYSQIKAYGSAGNGPAYWVVKTKAGLTMEYGNTADSRIEAVRAAADTATWPAGTVRVWANNQISDAVGNYMTASYIEDSGNGEFYPSHIAYAGNAVTGNTPAYSVRFELTATARLDMQTQYQAGAVIKTTKRIGNVKILNGATLVNDFRLEYLAQGSAKERSKINKLTQCEGVENCLPPIVLSWADGSGGWGLAMGQTGLHGVGSIGKWFVDINGDGRVDYVTKNNDDFIHWDLAASPVALNYAWAVPQSQGGLNGAGSAGRWFVDINGDGMADYVTKNNDGTILWNLSTGTGWAAPQSQSGLHGVGSAGMWFVDINGDGMADYVTKNNDGTILWNLSTGDGWAAPQSQSDLIGVGSAGIWFVDINGDGMADYVTKYNNGIIYWDLNTYTPVFLTSISNSGGVTTTLAYKPITDSTIYAKDAPPDAAVYPKVDLQYPLYVVSQVQQSNGAGGMNTTQYKYGGLKAEMGTGRGLLGFRWSSAKELATGIERYTEYRQDFPYTGVPLKNETRLAGAGNAGVLKRNTSTVACQNPQTGAACTVAAGNRYFPHVTQSVEESWDLGGMSFPSIITSYVYGQSPQHGDPTQITVNLSDGSSKTTVNEYWAADTGNWILGRLKRASVTSSQP